jgi:hypothetical protein
VLADINADIQHADHRAAAVENGVVVGHVLRAEQGGVADIRPASQQLPVARMGAVERRAEWALAVLPLHRRGDADEVLRDPDEKGRCGARFFLERVGQHEIQVQNRLAAS